MRIGMPHMGHIYIPFKTMFRELNVDLVLPPPCSQRTLSLGAKYSPEGLCIPFKLTLGNFIEALDQGADTLIMAGGFGVCRLGYYAKTQDEILHDMGYDFEMISMGVSEKKFAGLIGLIKRLSNGASWPKVISAFRFGLAKLNALDELERKVQKVRAIELQKGTASRLFKEATRAIDEASSQATLKRVRRDYTERLSQVPQDTRANPLKVGITGEFYVVLEPFSNMDVEVELGKLGVEVKRSTFISEWIKFSLFLNPFGLDEKRKIHKAAWPYLKRDIGGDGWESVGEKVLHAKDYDGLVHLAPFTCMPEIIAQNIMPSTKEDIPVLTILCDEQMGKQGMLTRIEAFVDLLQYRRRRAQRNNS